MRTWRKLRPPTVMAPCSTVVEITITDCFHVNDCYTTTCCFLSPASVRNFLAALRDPDSGHIHLHDGQRTTKFARWQHPAMRRGARFAVADISEPHTNIRLFNTSLAIATMRQEAFVQQRMKNSVLRDTGRHCATTTLTYVVGADQLHDKFTAECAVLDSSAPDNRASNYVQAISRRRRSPI